MARLKGKHVRQDDGGRRRATRSEGTQAHRDVKAGRSRGPKHLRTNNASPASRQSAQSESSQGRRGQSRTGRSDADHGRTSQGRPSQNRPTQSNPAPHRTTQSWPNSSASRRASQSRTGQGSSSAPRLATQSRFSRSSAPQGRPSQSRTGQGSPASRRASQSRTSQGSPSTRRSTPSQGTRRTAPRHRRNQSSLQKLRLRLRSPYLAYAVVAIAFGALLFALTMPAEPDYVEEPPTIEEPQKPYPEHDEYVEPRAVAHEFAGSSAAAVSATNAYGVLTQAIGQFEDMGYAVSFAVRDMGTGNDLTYDSGRVQYPASSIKAPYTTCVFQKLVETGQVPLDEVMPLAEPTILESSDEGYRAERERYGPQVFAEWLQDAGVGYGEYASYDEMLHWNYPHLNTDQLLLMWLHIYDYVESGTEPAMQLKHLLEYREVSALRAALGVEQLTLSKMGWFEYYGDWYSEPATVEGGVVYASEGTYVVAVMTTAPAQIPDLEPIFVALARAHYDMI